MTLVLFLCVSSLAALSPSIDWCLYFRIRNVYRPECKFYDTPPSWKRSREGATKLTNMKLPTCSPLYKHCTLNEKCRDGEKRCLDMTMFRECCAPWKRECPPPKWLNFECVVEKAADWCTKDGDCAATPSRLCCPSGCGFNICL
ncbi:unnamed protein product [Caenorhabditis auriculariae]|uniref:WAP domain-containing protein n=1 Tax=Caenorhabditis auriculariae TaxID=2777116 RepID=A0A8S1GZW9_9PELO|nr:unnamed protein product [Caenorhabditis auriculariae]